MQPCLFGATQPRVCCDTKQPAFGSQGFQMPSRFSVCSYCTLISTCQTPLAILNAFSTCFLVSFFMLLVLRSMSLQPSCVTPISGLLTIEYSLCQPAKLTYRQYRTLYWFSRNIGMCFGASTADWMRHMCLEQSNLQKSHLSTLNSPDCRLIFATRTNQMPSNF